LPSLAEQLRIAAVLDKADAIRRMRRESLRLLDEFLRSAFLEMFGDPVRNEKGWEALVLGSVAREAQYGTSAKANTDRRGIPVLRMNNITAAGSLDLSELKWCEIAPRDLPKYTVRRGDLLFNRTNSPELVGKTAVWDRDDAFAFAGYLVRVRFDDSRVLPEYVSAYLNSSYGKQLLFEKAKPSNNMSNISASELMRLHIPVPPLDLQRRYLGMLVKAREAMERVLAAAAAGDMLFDSLALVAFAGGE
jgi:type I restriction enzyme S subunit